MDLLALIAADPTLLPLWAVMLFAAGMYPVGMMFGCSPCCDPCVCASGSTLPETITVTLDGFTDYSKNQICTLSFSACYGSGGSGTVDAPGQSSPESDPVDDRGPITAVSLTDGGGGYAKLGRTAPTLSASVYTSTGSGASLDVTVTKAAAPDECGLDYWEVSKVALLDGGTGYGPWDGVQISPSEGDSAESGAVFSVTLAQLPPDLTLGVSSQAGTGAELTPQTDEHWWSTPQARAWRIQSVTVDDGGDGYTHLDTVTVTRGTGTVLANGFWSDAWLSLVTANTEPTVSASVESTGGTGASLSVTLAETEIYPPPAYSAVSVWAVESIAVDSAGTGYAQFDTVWLSVVDGDTRSTAASAYVSEVDANGGILAVFVYSGGEYFKGGPITAVSVVDGGGYVKRNGEIESVAVTNGGKYYREDASLPPYVASVTVNITQASNTPTAGTGAVITATVEDDPQSPDFGKITGLTVDDGGDGYLGWVWETNDCCGHYLNGQQIVLARFKDSNAAACETATKSFLGQYNIPFSVNGEIYSVSSDCVYTTQFCGGWESPFLSGVIWDKRPANSKLQLYVGYRGEGQRPVAKLGLHCYGGIGSDGGWTACHQDWIADEPIESCSQFAFSATPPGKPFISVAPGGAYDPDWRFSGCGEGNDGTCQSCNVCCQGSGDEPEEIEVSITDEWTTNRPSGLPDFSGTYVAAGGEGVWIYSNLYNGGDGVAFSVGLHPCHSGLLPVYLTQSRDNCETCIKQCRAWFGGIWLQWQHNGFSQSARVAPEDPSDDCGECESTPVCSPSGKTFSLSISSTFGQTGWGNGTHAATATIL
jgi:hypothetical protein